MARLLNNQGSIAAEIFIKGKAEDDARRLSGLRFWLPTFDLERGFGARAQRGSRRAYTKHPKSPRNNPAIRRPWYGLKPGMLSPFLYNLSVVVLLCRHTRYGLGFRV